MATVALNCHQFLWWPFWSEHKRQIIHKNDIHEKLIETITNSIFYLKFKENNEKDMAVDAIYSDFYCCQQLIKFQLYRTKCLLTLALANLNESFNKFIAWNSTTVIVLLRDATTNVCHSLGTYTTTYLKYFWVNRFNLINNRRMSWQTDTAIHGQIIHPIEKFISLNFVKFL